MPISITVTETDYMLPEDGEQASQDFIGLFTSTEAGDTFYVSAYDFTYRPMYDAIKQADSNGVVFHLLLDESCAQEGEEKSQLLSLVQSFQASGSGSTITITTAGLNSPEPKVIWHWKALVRVSDSTCWEGSTNFTSTAWDEGNSCRKFTSSIWAEAFVNQFKAHEAWARQNLPNVQVM